MFLRGLFFCESGDARPMFGQRVGACCGAAVGCMQKMAKKTAGSGEKSAFGCIHSLPVARLCSYSSIKYNILATLPLGGSHMIRSELIQKIADDNPHLYQRDVERIVNTIFEEITGAMSKGDRVELRGFGAFSVKQRDARVGRNPRTGESVNVDEKHVPFFKTGKLLRDRLNGRG